MAELADDSGFQRARNEYWECKSWYAEVETSIAVMLANAVIFGVGVLAIEWYRGRMVRRAEQERHAINDRLECVRQLQHHGEKGLKENISTHKLVKVYEKKVEAVKGVDLKVHEKQIIGLLGPNGAGKSSTFNMITMQT